MAVIQLERNGALSGVHAGVRPKTKLTEPALSETLIDPRIECTAVESSLQLLNRGKTTIAGVVIASSEVRDYSQSVHIVHDCGESDYGTFSAV